MEKTLILVKPDGIMKGLIGEILSRFEKRAYKIIALKFIRVSEDKAQKLYAPHFGKPFYEPLIKYITSGPVVSIVIEGDDIIKQARKIIGATNPKEASPGTIRGDFAQKIEYNLIHGSDSEESAQREIPIFFSPEELLSYELNSAYF
ncbi:MAG: nucleoside-diphosphate kinase [Armatimonadetes bacterium]|nr:nucleoside-diphosphate kinase [Armatimonadota bacterium]